MQSTSPSYNGEISYKVKSYKVHKVIGINITK
jgi:hypothetical protein